MTVDLLCPHFVNLLVEQSIVLLDTTQEIYLSLEDKMRALDVTNFDEALRAAEGLVLVDFWAPWCGPCRAVSPTLEALSEEYQGQLEFFKVNVEENHEFMDAFRLKSIPAVLMLKPNEEGGGARVLDALIGARTAEGYREWIDRHLNPPPSLLKRILGVFKS